MECGRLSERFETLEREAFEIQARSHSFRFGVRLGFGYPNNKITLWLAEFLTVWAEV
jgi:hypothetical protein